MAMKKTWRNMATYSISKLNAIAQFILLICLGNYVVLLPLTEYFVI